MDQIIGRSNRGPNDVLGVPLKGIVIVLTITLMFAGIERVRAADGWATKAISAGALNSVVLKSDGTVWAWGHNVYGESGNLSLGQSSAITNPVVINSSVTNAVAVASGGWDSSYSAHTLILTSDGLVLASGTNASGQLGDGTALARTNPVVVTNLTGVVAIAAGSYHSLALKSDGKVWGWGANHYGQLGNGTNAATQKIPVQVTNLATVIAIAAGKHHSLALKSDGTVWAWGTNNYGQLGNGNTTLQKSPIQTVGLTNVIAIAAGAYHSLALKADGTVWGWGYNSQSQVGNGTITTPQTKPVKVVNLTNVVAIAAGGYHSLALNANGSVWGWGRNDYGQLGKGAASNYELTPALVSVPGKVLSVAAGEFHSLALMTDGTIAAWGYSFYGQVGNGAPIQTAGQINSKALLVKGFGGVGIQLKNHSLAVSANGSVWSMGDNRFGQLGDGTTVNVTKPVEVKNQFETITSEAGGGHSLAVKLDGSVWSWGANNYGQLGDGVVVNRALSANIGSAMNVIQVAGGNRHSLALQTNGLVWSWGGNDYGQVGDGSTANRSTPSLISGLTNASYVAAGAYHSLAVSNGFVWSWGGNDYGQLGDGTLTNRTSLIRVSGLTNITAVGAGGQHSLALSNGLVWAWGNNNCGQLGDGTTTNRLTPIKVSNLSGIMAITAGRQFSAALSSNGTVWTWGYNAYGQLGDGTTTNRFTPIQATNLAGVKAIVAGENHLMVTMNDGRVRMLGANSSGELGIGTTDNQSIASFIPGFYLTQLEFTASLPNAFATNAFVYYRGIVPGWFDSIAMVAPLDFQRGIALDRTGSCAGLFGGSNQWLSMVQKDTRYQVHVDLCCSPTNKYDYTSIVFDNPIVAFGETEGGTPLYVRQPYRFGIFPGLRIESASNPEFTNPVRILVYSRTNFVPGASNIAAIATNDIFVPRKTIASDQAAWTQFASNGFSTRLEAYGLRTTLTLFEPATFPNSDGTAWGFTNGTPFGLIGREQYILTHTATEAAKDYFYRIEAIGAAALWTTWVPFVTNATGQYSRSLLYTLDFSDHPSWRPMFVDQPQYEHTPEPSTYWDKSSRDLTNTPTVTSYPIALSQACTNIDQSPELRRHPILDQFVRDMGNDPIALTRYVLNEIELSDYMACDSNAPTASINLGGINRGALGTFLEKQGSPAEQCALLVYLLRQAGFKAAYIYPTNSNLRLLDTRLDTLMRMRLKGAKNDSDWSSYTTDEMIAVNYPWVVANSGTNTVHLFPWLKDTEVVEGFDLYEYMPESYNSGFKWVRDYLYGKANVISSIYMSNTPAKLFPKFIEDNLRLNHPGISLDDIGVRIRNRRLECARWSEFPVPNIVTNLSQTALVQEFASITNTLPWATNYFDTVRVQIVRADNTNTIILTSGDMRMADIHNRRFVVATNNSGLMMWMSAFGTNAGAGKFGNYATNNYLATQSNVVTITPTTSFQIQFIYKRHQFGYGFTGFMGVTEMRALTNAYATPCVPQDVIGLCISPGRVTKPMLDVHAQDFWKMEAKKRQDTNYVASVTDYKGAVAYMMGMTYFQRTCNWDDINKRLHKIRGFDISRFLSGIARFSVGAGGKTRPKLDMVGWRVTADANYTLHPDVDSSPNMAISDYNWLLAAGNSAEEHETINQFMQTTNSISSVMLLQLAQRKSGPTTAGIVDVHKYNYASRGASSSAGYSGTALKDYDAGIWSSIDALFKSTWGEGGYAFVTPAPMTNSDNSYKGMGTLVLSPYEYFALIGQNMNGGVGTEQVDLTSSPGQFSHVYTESVDGENAGYALERIVFGSQGSQPETLTTSLLASSGSFGALNSVQQTYTGTAAELLGVAGLSSGSTSILTTDLGLLGWSSYQGTFGSLVSDPVNPITGEFYINAADLALPGVMPLEIRRNYSSQNIAENQFGFGWKWCYTPYLVLATNALTQLKIIYAAEEDGSVIVYRQTGTNSSSFAPLPVDNPQLNNFSTAGIGSSANLFNNSITNYSVDTNQYYKLSGSDGSVRLFLVQSFPIISATNTVNRQRPYLARWEDNRGNWHSFEYGNDSSRPDYGQVRRIQNSNGSFLGFNYDAYRHIVGAYSGDGRRLYYDYDDHGDLVKVTLPDASEITYEYQHIITPTNTYSTHLIVREVKPDGRVLENVYDRTNRVIVQLATVGVDLNTYTNAQFSYSNNFMFNATNGISGATWITDINGKVSSYEYTSNLITTITDPYNQTISQQWYWTNDSAGGYARSLKSRTDKRQLTTKYFYDSKGNVISNIVSGADLTGDGLTATTNFFGYNTTNNILMVAVDTMSNMTKYVYADPKYPYLPTAMERYASNGTAISTNLVIYTSISNVVVNGYATSTNQAFGLIARSIRAAGSGDAATNDFAYDSRGYRAQGIAYTGTGDPHITNTFFYNDRGELVESIDAAGRARIFEYDAGGRMKAKEIYESGQQNPMDWEITYYNENGEVTWQDGPRYNPEDYVWQDWDSHGHVTQQIRWRSRAKADGSGVEAEVGDNLYATMFYEYDGIGNLVKARDQMGNYSRMAYNALGQMVERRSYAPNNAASLATERFAYEPGGQVSTHTNALGGVTRKYYTTTGKLAQQSNPDGSMLRWTYFPDGRPRREYLANSNYWETTYDDAQRLVRRTFSGDANYLETKVFDRRGNLVITTNVVGVVFTATYDGLDRIKERRGPDEGFGQRVEQYAYDNSGKQVVVTNALGEFTITTFDALARVITNAVYDPAGNRISVASTVFRPDHHGATTIIGSGTNAIPTITFTDTYGKEVLTHRVPASGVTNYTINKYDILENLVSRRDELGQTTTNYYDSLKRLNLQILADGTPIAFGYNSMGSLTNRLMPGGLTWSAAYDSANRILNEQLAGGTLTNRQYSYQYYDTNSPFVGLLKSRIDMGRNTTNTLSYDAYLRLATNAAMGTASEQNVSLSYKYDRRGLATNMMQFLGLSSVTSNQILRSFGDYGQIIDEQVLINGGLQSDFSENWNAAGRRSQLSQLGAGSGGSISYSYRADGRLTNIYQGGANFAYRYADNGLLTTRSNAWRVLNVGARDGMGRLLRQTNVVGGANASVEIMTWRANSTLAGYSATRSGAGAWNDSRDYLYNNRNQLTKEPIGLSTGVSATNNYSFDANKLGVLTRAQWSGGLTNGWQASQVNTLGQVAQESWNGGALTLRASGVAGGASGVSATLDGAPVSNLVLGDGRWYVDLMLSPTTHTLTATATYPVGQFTNSATSTFTVAGTNFVTDYYDGAGNVTNRVFASGKTQSLTWDNLGRMVGMTQRDSLSNGFNWMAIYDGLGRRLRTVHTPVGTNVINTGLALTIDAYFDPLVEFQEMAVAINQQRTWKVLGLDVSGQYGGMQGVGGLETTIRESDGQMTPVINDYFGNVLATIAGATANWNPVRIGGYGAALGYQAPVLSLSTTLAESLMWRSGHIDPTGFYWLGARYYDPIAGRFLSADPFGHDASLDLYSAFNGNPINCFDPTGRDPFSEAQQLSQVLGSSMPLEMQQDLFSNPRFLDQFNITQRQGNQMMHDYIVGGATATWSFSLGMTAGYVAGPAAIEMLSILGVRSTAALLISGGVASGAASSATSQGVEMLGGYRNELSWTELGLSAALGGSLDYSANWTLAPKLVNDRLSANAMDRLAVNKFLSTIGSEEIAGTQIRFRTPDPTVNPIADYMLHEQSSLSGYLGVEIKGNLSKPTYSQYWGYPYIVNGEGIPYGAKAAEMGLLMGEPLPPTPFFTVRYLSAELVPIQSGILGGLLGTTISMGSPILSK